MTKIWNLAVVLLMTAVVFSCTPKSQDKEPVNTVKLSGTITNPTEGGFTVYYYRLFDNEKVVLGNATPDEQGKFSMTFELNNPKAVQLSYNEEISEMFLEPGDDISLSLDTKLFDETIKYEGTGAARNNYLAAKTLASESLNQKMRDVFGNVTSQTAETVKTFADSVRNGQEALYTKMLAEQTVSEDFAAFEKANIISDWAYKLQLFPNLYKRRAKEDAELPENYEAFWEEIPMTNDKGLTSSSFRGIFDSYLYNKLADKESEELSAYADYLKKKLDFITANYQGEIKAYLHAATLSDVISEIGGDYAAQAYKSYMDSQPNMAHASIVSNIYESWNAIDKGKPAPNFTYTSIDGEEVSLSDLKGKVVYVDVWATWCGPCRKEFPHAKELKKKFEGNDDIVFLYVSLDDDVAAWEKFLADTPDLKGLHLASREGWKTSIVENYMINGIPRYMMIDKEGNIFNANASRPSEEATATALQELLEGSKES